MVSPVCHVHLQLWDVLTDKNVDSCRCGPQGWAVNQMLVSLMILALNTSENSIICIKLLFFGLFLAFEKSPKSLANSCNSHPPKSFFTDLHSCRLPAVAAGRQRPTVTFELASCSETPDSPALAPQRKMLYPLTLLIYFSFICKMKNTYLS